MNKLLFVSLVLLLFAGCAPKVVERVVKVTPEAVQMETKTVYTEGHTCLVAWTNTSMVMECWD